jgi:hypothetical protein
VGDRILRRTLVIALVGSAAPLAPGLAAAAGAQTWATAQYSRQLQDEAAIAVRVRYGTGQFQVAPVATDHLYRVRLRYDEEAFEPLHEFRNDRLTVGVEGTQRRTSLRRGDRDGEMDLHLSTRIPMDLRLEFGAVRAEMDLGGLQLTGLDLTTGASDSELRVSAPNPLPMDRASFQVAPPSSVR